jgi:hypothetical protein
MLEDGIRLHSQLIFWFYLSPVVVRMGCIYRHFNILYRTIGENFKSSCDFVLIQLVARKTAMIEE